MANRDGTPLGRINNTARDLYETQGPGIGSGAGALDYLLKWGVDPATDCNVLEIGFGEGKLFAAFQERGCNALYGVEFAQAAIDAARVLCAQNSRAPQPILAFLDVSHEPLPLRDNSVDYAFCTETLEHLSNPYFMFCEVKRVLRHRGLFVLSFPQPARSLGYGGGDHGQIYPSFLLRDSFERFAKQLYFSVVAREENGSSDWYLLKNYKRDGIVDVFEVISGNYDERELYGCLEGF